MAAGVWILLSSSRWHAKHVKRVFDTSQLITDLNDRMRLCADGDDDQSVTGGMAPEAEGREQL